MMFREREWKMHHRVPTSSFPQKLELGSFHAIRDLSNDDDDGNENVFQLRDIMPTLHKLNE